MNLDSLAYRAIKGFFAALGVIPRPVALRLANGIGRIWYGLDRRHRRTALQNLERAFSGEKSASERRLLARQVFKNLALVIFEMAWVLRLDPAKFATYFTFENLACYQNARLKNKGVLVLTAHTGNWELLVVNSKMTGSAVSVIYRPLDFTPMDRFICEMRSRFGAVLIPKNNAIRDIVRSLRRGESVTILFDQSVKRQRGVFVDFFRQPTCTNKGLALLALKTGAPVVPMLIARTPTGFKTEIGPEIPLIKTGDVKQDVAANSALYNQAIESFIRRHPDQWFWVHRRWKVKPPADLQKSKSAAG